MLILPDYTSKKNFSKTDRMLECKIFFKNGKYADKDVNYALNIILKISYTKIFTK